MAKGKGSLSDLLPAMALGAVAWAALPPAAAQTSGERAAATAGEEVVIMANRQADAEMTAKVEQAIKDDPWIFSGHISVITENGVVRLEGLAYDRYDMYRALKLARRIAGSWRRVVNDLDLCVQDDDGGS